ncbi:GNAT family N-acetyltransferase [Hungatella hathewayi]
MEEYVIRTINISSTEEWDGIVRSFKNYDVYSLSGYVKAFQIHGDGIPLLFYFESKDLRAFNVVMKRDVADDLFFIGKLKKNKWFDLITPYGYGGWLIEGNGDTSKLDSVYSKICVEQNIVCEFVRYHPVWNNASRMDQMYQVIYLGSTIAMDLSDQKTIWDNIISKNRNMIRKAIKKGVKVVQGREPDDFFNFQKMYNETMNKDTAEDYYYFNDEFYNSIRIDLEQNAKVFTAIYEGKPIAAAIMIYANGKLNYHLSGSDINYRTLAPTNLLLYEAANWGSEQGFSTFHLGGGLGSREDSLYKFKRAFYKGETKRFAIGRKIFLHDAYEDLNAYRTDVSESSFFPEYRRPSERNKE